MKTIIKEIDSLCLEQDRYGYTIPYLYKIELDNHQQKSIPEILEFLSKQSKSYIITYCKELKEYIIGLHKREYAPIHMYKNFGNLYYDQDSLGEFTSFDDLKAFMIDKYQIRIEQSTYSKNNETNNWE